MVTRLPVSFKLCSEFFRHTLLRIKHLTQEMTLRLYAVQKTTGEQDQALHPSSLTVLLSQLSHLLSSSKHLPKTREDLGYPSHQDQIQGDSMDDIVPALVSSISLPLEVRQSPQHMRSFMDSHQQKCGGSQFSLTDLLATEVLSLEMWFVN